MISSTQHNTNIEIIDLTIAMVPFVYQILNNRPKNSNYPAKILRTGGLKEQVELKDGLITLEERLKVNEQSKKLKKFCGQMEYKKNVSEN